MPAKSSHEQQLRVLGPRQEAILGSLLRYHYLLGRQLCRLIYKSGSRTFALTTLKNLTEAGYCQRIWLPKLGPRGSSPAVYSLARRGMNHLKAAGFEVQARYRPSEDEGRSHLFLTHTLELNDFLISAELLGRWAPEFQLAAFLHEHELKHRPVYIKTDDGKKAAVIPDAWVDLRIQRSFQVCLTVELDRGTEEQKHWRRKVANLLAYANGPYQKAFETSSLTIAVLTTAGEKRLLDLLAWTRAELDARRERAMGDLFLFAYIPPRLMDAERVFLTPCWYQPFKREPIALLETPWTT